MCPILNDRPAASGPSEQRAMSDLNDLAMSDLNDLKVANDQIEPRAASGLRNAVKVSEPKDVVQSDRRRELRSDLNEAKAIDKMISGATIRPPRIQRTPGVKTKSAGRTDTNS